MFEFHNDMVKYFDMQYKTSAEFIIPFIKNHVDLSKKLNVLEIGCAEAGVLKAFTELGHNCVGIELMQSRVDLATQFMAEEIKNNQIRFITKNIYDIDVEKDIGHRFDLIILKDVIEHIPQQEKFIAKLHNFLDPKGFVFFGFPPWYMPFGGHQQICKNKILSKLPYYHLLPTILYKGILKLFGEPEHIINELISIKQTGISIERFERLINKNNYQISKHKSFLTNPIYKYKFGLKVREQLGVIRVIPFVRNFLTTCVYYLVTQKD